MNKDLTQVFNTMLIFKNIKKESYIIDKEDIFVIYNYWKIYGFNKHMTFRGFRKCVVEYSVFSGKTLHNACEDLSKKIIFN